MGAALVSCDPPSEKSPTYTTTVSGKIITPARAADPTKGSTIGTAIVWADPNHKVRAKTDGSYSLKVTHAGTFTITAKYIGAGGKYKARAPKTFNTTNKNIDGENIVLDYGYSTTLVGRVITITGSTNVPRNGATVTIEVEGRVVGSTTTGGGLANYSITFAHPGDYRATASFTGLKNDIYRVDHGNEKTWRITFDLQP